MPVVLLSWGHIDNYFLCGGQLCLWCSWLHCLLYSVRDISTMCLHTGGQLCLWLSWLYCLHYYATLTICLRTGVQLCLWGNDCTACCIMPYWQFVNVQMANSVCGVNTAYYTLPHWQFVYVQMANSACGAPDCTACCTLPRDTEYTQGIVQEWIEKL